MNKRILAVAIASIFVTAACSRKHSDKKGGSKPAAPTPVQQDALKDAFGVFGNKFDSKDQTVSDKIVGVEAYLKDGTTYGPYSVDKKQTMQFKVLFKDTTNAVELYSETINPAIMAKGEGMDLTYEMSKEDLAKYIGGTLSAKARCLDTTCNRIGLLLQVWSGEGVDRQPKSAGIIFSYDKYAGYQVETSNSGKLSSLPSGPVPFM